MSNHVELISTLSKGLVTRASSAGTDRELLGYADCASTTLVTVLGDSFPDGPQLARMAVDAVIDMGNDPGWTLLEHAASLLHSRIVQSA